MRNIFAVLFALTAIAFAQAQSSTKVVVWSGDKNCGQPSGQFSCHALETPRGSVSVVNDKANAVSIAVGFYEEDDHIIAATHLKNTSDQPLIFDSDIWGAAHFSKRESAQVGRKPLLAETAIPSRDLVRGIRSGTAIDTSADSFMASIAKAGQVREVRQADGSRQRRLVIVDDQQAVTDAGLRNQAKREASNNEQERIRKHALTQKSVAAFGSVKGLVYFRRVKKAEVVFFSFRVLDSVYVFRLLRKV